MKAETKRKLNRLKLRLDKLALKQLREVAADLKNQVEKLQTQLYHAQDEADCWYNLATEMQLAISDDKYATHRCIGINKSGEMMVIKTDNKNN